MTEKAKSVTARRDFIKHATQIAAASALTGVSIP